MNVLIYKNWKIAFFFDWSGVISLRAVTVIGAGHFNGPAKTKQKTKADQLCRARLFCLTSVSTTKPRKINLLP